MRKAYTLVMGEAKELNFAQVEAILALKDEQCAELPGGLMAYLRRDICFATAKPLLPPVESSFALVQKNGWQNIDQLGLAYIIEENVYVNQAPGAKELLLPADLIDRLSWRARREGDAVSSLGKKGRRKLKDIFIDNHIPLYQRNHWPLLLLDDEIIWVGGLWKKDLGKADSQILIKIRLYDKI